MAYLLDTNMVSYILRKKATVLNKVDEVTSLGLEIFISGIAYYEVKRGLLAANATRQLAEFNQLCREYEVLLLDDIEIIERACKIHLALKSSGNRLEDADILIAATAMTRGLILVSNDFDMLRVRGMTLENWLQTEG